MKVLSLFDGMSCAQIALERSGIEVTNYFASEVDKYAIQVAKDNYPDMIHLGDVTKLETIDGMLKVDDRVHKIDLLVGGSPCQGFSFAGKQLNFDDPRSALFWEYVRLLRELKPKYFILENVKMKKEYMDVISDALGVQPVFINSSLVSAQNRQRYYWSNIDFDTPSDRNIVLKDIIEDGAVDREKAYCIDANYWKGGNLKSYFEKHRRQLVFSKDGLCHVGDADLKGHAYNRRVYHPDGKAPNLCAASGGNLEPKILVKGGRVVNRRLNKDGVREDYNMDIPLQQCVEIRKDDKTNCVSTIAKDAVVVNIPQIVQKGRGFNKGGLKGDKSPTLTTSYWEHNNHLTYDEGLTWRKLTPVECERLQTVPDGYTKSVSNTQRYRMLGNGFTVDVISHILNQIGEVK